MKKSRRWGGGEFIQCDEDSNVGGAWDELREIHIYSFIHSSGRCSWPPRPGGRCGWRSRVRQSNLSFSLSCCKVAPPHTWPQPPAGLGQLLSVRTAAGKQLDSSWGAAGEQLDSSWLLAKTPAHGYRQLNILFPCRMRSRSWAGRSFLRWRRRHLAGSRE